jgi:hypothetical protein
VRDGDHVVVDAGAAGLEFRVAEPATT